MSFFWISSYYIQIQALLSCPFVSNNMEQYQRETKLQMEIALSCTALPSFPFLFLLCMYTVNVLSFL